MITILQCQRDLLVQAAALFRREYYEERAAHEATRQQLDATRQQLDAIRQQRDAMQQQRDATRQQRDAMQQQLDAMQQQRDATRQQLGHARAGVQQTADALTFQLDCKHKEIQHLQQAREDDRAALEDLARSPLQHITELSRERAERENYEAWALKEVLSLLPYDSREQRDAVNTLRIARQRRDTAVNNSFNTMRKLVVATRAAKNV